MTLVVQQSDIGENIRDPLVLDKKRRRLSTVIMQQPRIKGRAYVVSVHRKSDFLVRGEEAFLLDDEHVMLREKWNGTLVGPDDVVIITYLPMGGAMGGGGGKGGGKNIAGMLGMLVLSVVAPMLIGALGPAFAVGGSLTLLGKIATAGLIAGVGYFISKATQPKANKEEDDRPVFGVSGGGNVPRPGDRIPVHYGRVWHPPDLSQPDYFYYEGEDQVLMKRMTIGVGEYDIHTIRVGVALMYQNGKWRDPFTTSELEIIPPGGRSKLVPSAVYSSDQVGGSELPRPGDMSGVDWMGPYPVVPPGETTSRIQLDYSLPQGLYAISAKNGNKLTHIAVPEFEYTRIDEDGRPVGGYMPLYKITHSLKVTRAQRFTKYVDVPEGRYAVRARSANPKYEGDKYTPYDDIMWDGLRSHLDKEPRRPNVTEVAMRIRSGKGTGTVSNYGDLWFEFTRKLPEWDGIAWTAPKVNRKAIWAAVDVIRNRAYGYGAPDSKIDLATFLHYARTVTRFDTFDGTIRGPIPVAEALGTILGVIRAEPTLTGDVWSMTRDEPRSVRKHMITRRQIVRDTSGVEFDLDMSDGSADVVVEWFTDGDPKRRQEHRVTIGEETLTPRRIQLFGCSDFHHAEHLAKWYASSAYYRREHRLLSTELSGRNFGRNDSALIDMWFLREGTAAGVDAINGFTVTMDSEVEILAGDHAVFRDETGLEWGPVAIDPTGDPFRFVVNASDAAVIGQFTGRTLSSLMPRRARKKLPMTVLIGGLQEITQPYIIRTVRPEPNGNVQVSAVIDADEVWHVLGEAPAPLPPISEVVAGEGDLLPILPWVRGECVQRSTGIYLDWSVGQARGAIRYVVEIRYEDEDADEAWEVAYAGSGTEGTYPLEFRNDVTVRVRARAINSKGVPSEYKYTTVTLFKPVLSTDIMDMLVEFDMLVEDLRHDITQIGAVGENTIRQNLRDLETRVDELALAAATEAGNSWEARSLVKVAVDEAWAAIQEESRVRIDQDGALAQQITTLSANFNADIGAALTAERLARASADEALAKDIVTMRATVGTDINAAITAERTVTVNREQAIAQSVNTVQSNLNGTNLQVTQVQQAINGSTGVYGVSIVADGRAVGGYRLEAARTVGGAWVTTFGIMGDLVVDGTIWGQKLAAANVITASAQIGNGIITNAHIGNAQITNAKIGNAEIDTLKLGQGAVTTSSARAGNMRNGPINIDVYVRGGGEMVIFVGLAGANMGGSPYGDWPTVYVDGVQVGVVSQAAIVTTTYGNNDQGTVYQDYNYPSAMQMFIVNNGSTRTRRVTVQNSRALQNQGVTVTVLEFAR